MEAAYLHHAPGQKQVVGFRAPTECQRVRAESAIKMSLLFDDPVVSVYHFEVDDFIRHR